MSPRESHWTPPSSWCEHPDRWSAATADATEHEVTALVAAFVTALQPDIVVETGCNTGQTSEAIGHALRGNGQGWLHTCDIDPDMIDLTRRRCEGLPVTTHHMPARVMPVPGKIGLLFLDSHAHERHLELEHFRPRLAPGAIVIVHDTAPHHPVHNYLAGALWPDEQMLRLRTPRGVSVIQCA